MIHTSIERLEFLLEIIPPLLLEIPETEFSQKPASEKWSKKEIIGHLTDSATNNHHRLVRGQFETLPRICYDQNMWNDANYYQKMDGKQLISFWTNYNRHLLALMKHLPDEKLENKVITGDGRENNGLSLSFVFEDYVVHLEHHLRQVIHY